MNTNLLYYGDNLEILREHIPAESVDLVYLDPPFNSNRNYNVIFKDESGHKSDAQLVAFEDTWHWGPSAERTYAYLTNTARHQGRVPDALTRIVAALRTAVGANQMTAYLVEMAVRLVELHRTLKPTGSLYLHCDPTASHYLKVVLDSIFEPSHFVNEIVWQRTTSHNDARQGSHHYGRMSDSLLFYTKTESYTWNQQYAPAKLTRSSTSIATHQRHGRPAPRSSFQRLTNFCGRSRWGIRPTNPVFQDSTYTAATVGASLGTAARITI